MRFDGYKCDICQTQKREANHWFRGYKLIFTKGVVVIEWEGKPTLDEVEASEAHLCGADCVMQWVSKNLL